MITAPSPEIVIDKSNKKPQFVSFTPFPSVKCVMVCLVVVLLARTGRHAGTTRRPFMSSMAVEAFTPRVTGRSDSPAMVHCRQKSRRTFTNTLQNNHQQQDNHHHHLSRILFSSRLFSAPFKEEVDPGVVEGLRIVKYPHPALRAENEEVTPKELKETKEIADLSRRMLKLMYNAEGVGLAAPQVGVNKRLMVYNPSGDSKRWLDETVLVNPRIVEYSDAQDEEIEGCLSFPDMSGEVVRSKWIKVEAMNLSGKKIKKKFSGWEARIFQHEYDHLDGTVYIDRLSEATRAKVQPRLDELIKEFGNDGAL